MFNRALIVLFVVGSFACGKKGDKESSSTEPAKAAEQPTAKPTEPMPAPAPAAPEQPAAVARPATPDEIDRCARLLAIASACGVMYDYEYGWIKSKATKLSAAAATKRCSVTTNIDEDGMSTFPATVLAPDALAKVEAAAKKNCAAVFDAVDEVDPGGGPAGWDPSR